MFSVQDEDDIGMAPPTGRAAFSASASLLNDIPKNDQVRCLATCRAIDLYSKLTSFTDFRCSSGQTEGEANCLEAGRISQTSVDKPVLLAG